MYVRAAAPPVEKMKRREQLLRDVSNQKYQKPKPKNPDCRGRQKPKILPTQDKTPGSSPDTHPNIDVCLVIL